MLAGAYEQDKEHSACANTKNAKNMRKTILGEHESCYVQKNGSKNTKYSRNERILKMGHLVKAIAHAKAIVFAKWSVWVKD